MVRMQLKVKEIEKRKQIGSNKHNRSDKEQATIEKTSLPVNVSSSPKSELCSFHWTSAIRVLTHDMLALHLLR